MNTHPFLLHHLFSILSPTCVRQSDGNLVIYGRNNPVWASNTNGVGTGSYILVMQNDDNLVLYNQNSPIWASGTCCR